jgi:hypothetical protein
MLSFISFWLLIKFKQTLYLLSELYLYINNITTFEFCHTIYICLDICEFFTE